MNIIFDLSMSGKSGATRFNGANEYVNAIIFRLDSFWKEQKESLVSKQLFFLIADEQYMDSQIINIIQSNDHFSIVKDDNQLDFEGFCKKNQVSVYYNPIGNVLRKADFSSLEVITTIHGLRSLELPVDKYESFTYSGYKQYVKYALKTIFPSIYKRRIIRQTKHGLSVNCKKLTIITPSIHTQYALFNFLSISDEQIRVFYSPGKPFTEKVTDNSFLEKNNILPDQFFLFVSANRSVKNPVRLIKAFDELAGRNLLKGKKIVLTGIDNNLRLAKKIKHKDHFILFDYIETQELESLYKNCFAFVYPTLNEGFGYPPIEAMKYGKPIIASATSSVPEILKGGALLFNPYSCDELKNRVLQLIYSPEIYSKQSIMSYCRHESINRRQKDDLEKLIRLIVPISE